MHNFEVETKINKTKRTEEKKYIIYLIVPRILNLHTNKIKLYELYVVNFF